MKETDTTKRANGDAAESSEVAAELSELRDLSQQLRNVAATAEDHVLRAILGKREALMGSIRARLGEEGAPEESGADSGQAANGKLVFDTMIEIVDMDRESTRVLKARSAQVAEEIRKIRAGRKFRESARLWK
jgi:hypothetical protein